MPGGVAGERPMKAVPYADFWSFLLLQNDWLSVESSPLVSELRPALAISHGVFGRMELHVIRHTCLQFFL